MNWLCRIGLHKWKWFRMTNEFYFLNPEWNGDVHRRCKRCGYMEMTTDGGETWSKRL